MGKIFLGMCPTTFEPLHVATANGSWWLRGAVVPISVTKVLLQFCFFIHMIPPDYYQIKNKDSIVNCTRVHRTIFCKK